MFGFGVQRTTRCTFPTSVERWKESGRSSFGGMATCGTVADLLRSTLFLLAVVCCSCQTDSASLTISIEQDTQTVELSFDSSDPANERRIEVAPDLMYTFSCMQSGGLDGNDEVWFSGGVTVSLNVSQRVYAMMPNSNSWILVFTSFSSIRDIGRYSCTSSGETLTLDIATANPAIIPGTPVLILNGGSQGNNRPSLRSFVSGTPFPSIAQGTWMFNGSTEYPPNSSPFERDFILSTTLTSEHSGRYTYSLLTSAGQANAIFDVTVIIDPALQIQPVRDQIVLVGQSVNITCSDSVGDPPPTFTWRFNGSPLQPDGSGVVILDESNSTHRVTRLVLNSATLQDSGDYECVAMNNPDLTRYNGQDLRVTVLSPPLSPEDITATPLSPCTANITWATPSPDSTAATTDTYILEIQLLNNGSAEQWVELGRSPSPPLEVPIPSRGLNTTYNLRGRGYNSGLGSGESSVTYGAFVSYQDDDFPAIMDVTGRPVGSNSILVSWTVESSMCYMLEDISVSCSSVVVTSEVVVASEGGGMSRLVTGLLADTEYSCGVSGVLTEAGQLEAPRIREPVAVTVSTNTLPGVPARPSNPQLDGTTVVRNRFTVTFEPLPADQDISHYHILVLRLSSGDALPSDSPDTLYPNTSTFSTCTAVNTLSPVTQNTTYQPYLASEFAADEFPPTFVVGGGGVADPGELEQCNENLVPEGVYTVFLRAYPSCESCQGGGGARVRRQALQRQYEVFSSSDYLPPATLPSAMESTDDHNSTTVIIICVVIVGALLLIILVAALFLFCYYRRTRTKSLAFSPSVDISLSSSDSDLTNYPDTPDLGRRKNGIELKAMEAFADPIEASFQTSGPIRREDFEKHVEKMDAKRQLLFTEEFEWIGKKSPWHPAEASNDPENDHKNRYSNITAFDHSAVKLKPRPRVEHSDYINANYITGYSKAREYIATQGPLDRTVEDFWRMIWEQQTTTIIMLTNLVELGKIKCSQYWPNSSKTMYEDIAVTLESTHYFPDYIMRTLGVQSAKTKEQRQVLLFHYTKWPDYGTPKLAAPLLNFLRTVHEANDSVEKSGPMVVHCSAGVGRSGTVLTIDYCLQQLRKEGVADICKFVCNMREQRNYMVQTDQQYTFIHYAILESIAYGDTSYDVKGFMDSYSKLQSSSPSSSPSKLLLGEEFQRLGAVKTMVKKSSFQNRIKIKGAPQRHFHSSFHGGSASGSFQQCLGHFLDGYNQSNMFLLTEGPDDITALRFWEIIWDHNCSSIVMLTPLDTEELFQYWPESGEAELQFGSIKVMVESESAEHLYTCRRIRLTNTKVEGISHQLVQYQFMGWTEERLPRVPDFVSFICDVINKVDAPTSETNSKILVHDLASLGPAGVFSALFYSIQRLQTEKVVDIFQAVQMIQLQRPGCVSQVEEYAFLYDCVYEFLIKNS